MFRKVDIINNFLNPVRYVFLKWKNSVFVTSLIEKRVQLLVQVILRINVFSQNVSASGKLITGEFWHKFIQFTLNSLNLTIPIKSHITFPLVVPSFRSALLP